MSFDVMSPGRSHLFTFQIGKCFTLQYQFFLQFSTISSQLNTKCCRIWLMWRRSWMLLLLLLIFLCSVVNAKKLPFSDIFGARKYRKILSKQQGKSLFGPLPESSYSCKNILVPTTSSKYCCILCRHVSNGEKLKGNQMDKQITNLVAN